MHFYLVRVVVFPFSFLVPIVLSSLALEFLFDLCEGPDSLIFEFLEFCDPLPELFFLDDALD